MRVRQSWLDHCFNSANCWIQVVIPDRKVSRSSASFHNGASNGFMLPCVVFTNSWVSRFDELLQLTPSHTLITCHLQLWVFNLAWIWQLVGSWTWRYSGIISKALSFHRKLHHLVFVDLSLFNALCYSISDLLACVVSWPRHIVARSIHLFSSFGWFKTCWTSHS